MAVRSLGGCLELKNIKIVNDMKAKKINGYFQIIDYDYEISQVESTYKNFIIQNSVDDDTINSILLKLEENRTMSDLKKIIERKKIDDWLDKKKSEFNGYKDLIVVPYEGKIEEYEMLNPKFSEEENQITQTYEKIVSKQLINEIILNLKNQLSSTDYIIIKAYEAKVMMQDAPYSDEFMTKTIEERQKMRDEINRLEELLKTAK